MRNSCNSGLCKSLELVAFNSVFQTQTCTCLPDGQSLRSVGQIYIVEPDINVTLGSFMHITTGQGPCCANSLQRRNESAHPRCLQMPIEAVKESDRLNRTEAAWLKHECRAPSAKAVEFPRTISAAIVWFYGSPPVARLTTCQRMDCSMRC